MSAKVKKMAENLTVAVIACQVCSGNVPGLIFPYRLGTLFFIMPRLLLQVCMVFSDLEQKAADLERNSPLKREMRERDR